MSEAQDPPTLYLAQLPRDRERIAVRRAFGIWSLLLPLLQDLTLAPPWFWAILELPLDALPNLRGSPIADGEIDVVLGPLTPAAGNGLDWPPKEGPLAGLEAKAGYLELRPAAACFRSPNRGRGKERRLKKELTRLVDLGCNRVGLLDIVTTPRSTSDVSGQAWLRAAALGATALDVAAPDLRARARTHDAIGHWALGWGAVEGGTEDHRGAGGLWLLHPSADLPRLRGPDVALTRVAFAMGVRTLLARVAAPHELPGIFRYCADCRGLHVLPFGSAGGEPCPMPPLSTQSPRDMLPSGDDGA